MAKQVKASDLKLGISKENKKCCSKSVFFLKVKKVINKTISVKAMIIILSKYLPDDYHLIFPVRVFVIHVLLFVG